MASLWDWCCAEQILGAMPWQIARPVSALRVWIGLDVRDELCVAHGRMAALPKPQVGNVALQAGEAPVQAQEARRRNHARSSWPFIPMTQERLPLDSQSQLRPHPGITGGALTHADAWVWPLEMLMLLV